MFRLSSGREFLLLIHLGQEVLGGQEAVGLGQLLKDGDLLGVGVADADEDGGKVLLHAGDRQVLGAQGAAIHHLRGHHSFNV